ncbi:MAG: ferric reductase-like transmembrane domain-containing protein [Candidatus Kerfeldbacteria bacterium]
MAEEKIKIKKSKPIYRVGNLLIVITLHTTMILWFLAKTDFWLEITSYPMLLISQIASLFGMTLLSWSMLLSSRLHFVEYMFGGLDKVYAIHKKVSIYGIVLLIVHPITLALMNFPDKIFNLKFFLPTNGQLPLDVGIIGFWLFIILTVITLYIKLTYERWRFTHKFYGLALLFGYFHMLGTPSDTSIYPLLGYWMMAVGGTGLAAYIYIQFFYKSLAAKYKYKVSKIVKKSDTYLVSFEPEGNKMKYNPGQFAYITYFDSEVKKEMHPFSITSHVDENELSFAIKILGDYTSSLDNLKIGDQAEIYGPYGRFSDKLSDDKDLIFIGGGVGVAPFVSMVKDAAKKNNGQWVSLYYCTKTKNDACLDIELTGVLGKIPDSFYINQCSDNQGRLSVDTVMKRVRKIDNTVVFLCGPHQMMNDYQKKLIEQGLKKDNIVMEDFSFGR